MIGLDGLEPPALSASGHKRMVNGLATANGKNGLTFPQESPGSVAYFNIEGPFVEIGPRSVFDKSAVGVRQ